MAAPNANPANLKDRMQASPAGGSRGKRDPRIAIIGGGLSGITVALELKKKLGLTSFTIYEKQSQPGGTWRDNTYPGCACDVPSHWYSLSTEQNPNWSMVYSPQPEIQAYWVAVHKKHNLQAFTQYDSSFESARWNSSKSVYEIKFARQSDKSQTFMIEAEILISAIGGFSKPLDEPPSLKGLKDFQGERFHSARWRHDVSLANKRVGIIGNGCSAAQFLPEVAKDPSTHILNFSRTPSWFFPRHDQREYSAFTKFAFAHIPLVMKAYRAFLAVSMDTTWINWRKDLPSIRHYAEEVSAAHIRKTAPAKYHDFLVPRYPFGCKRIIRDPGYLTALGQDNVELITDGIDTITEKGIRGKSGEEYSLDVIILGTGFDLTADGLGIDVTGSHGKSVTDQWNEQGGPQAYLGTVLSGFPNFFLILGPNVATGHASVIYSTEAQVKYIVEMVKDMRKYGAKSLELKTDAEDRYNAQLQHRLKNTVWSGSCKSYYKLERKDGSEKVIATWPGTLFELSWRLRKPQYEHFQQRGGSSIALAKRVKKIVRLLALIAAVVYVRKVGIDEVRNNAIIFAAQRYAQLRRLISR